MFRTPATVRPLTLHHGDGVCSIFLCTIESGADSVIRGQRFLGHFEFWCKSQALRRPLAAVACHREDGFNTMADIATGEKVSLLRKKAREAFITFEHKEGSRLVHEK